MIPQRQSTYEVRAMVGRDGEWINKSDLLRFLKGEADKAEPVTKRILEQLIIDIAAAPQVQ